MTIRAFLGGSFDPVHSSHLAMAMRVHTTLSQSTTKPVSVQLMPTKGNPFKGKPTSDEHRLAMLDLATAGTPIGIEMCELERKPPIYTIDTVRLLRQIHPQDQLIFILGQDSLHTLPTWKDGDEILDFVNIWAFMRGDFKPVGDLSAQVLENLTDDLGEFLSQNGRIYQDSTPITAMSSSQIRTLIANKDPKASKYLPPKISDYILKHALYDETVI
ncbi:nicotinate (nicotinamide) nucleotide adenylyltransferase [Moraxella sp. Tifton1]|uniref:nicotinate (nicotinamide) nucleotide adenylyltransferase n=1 Tax=Moraxella oculi TaxID=2940516 RepID=UPI00201343B9|nr:nicotinate (nicotinamide) nucleotide adenylyltransferase [Moraxella sp. Tifton1]MCL1624302.1 nicotinate (nicotinamide) nucleotide adenylyltransferase [Moraxella sp. Tifton1]